MSRPPGAAVDDGGSPPSDGLLASGVDVVSIERIGDLLERFGDSFAERVYTPAERAYCSGKPRPAQHYAARWAAKEAAIKALPDRDSVPPCAVEVERDGQRPRLAFSGAAAAAADALARSAGLDRDRLRTAVSLAHDREADVAVAHLVVGRCVEAP